MQALPLSYSSASHMNCWGWTITGQTCTVSSRAIVIVFVSFWGIMKREILYRRLPGLIFLVCNGTVMTYVHKFEHGLDLLWSPKAV
jgi:hypothetical protein